MFFRGAGDLNADDLPGREVIKNMSLRGGTTKQSRSYTERRGLSYSAQLPLRLLLCLDTK